MFWSRVARVSALSAGSVLAVWRVSTSATEGIASYDSSARITVTDSMPDPNDDIRVQENSERLIPTPHRKRVCVYGGSFNPITTAHLNVAAESSCARLRILRSEAWQASVCSASASASASAIQRNILPTYTCAVMHSKLVDEVWITPCGPRPDKPSLKTSMIHRLVMCHLAVDTTFGSRFGADA